MKKYLGIVFALLAQVGIALALTSESSNWVKINATANESSYWDVNSFTYEVLQAPQDSLPPICQDPDADKIQDIPNCMGMVDYERGTTEKTSEQLYRVYAPKCLNNNSAGLIKLGCQSIYMNYKIGYENIAPTLNKIKPNF